MCFDKYHLNEVGVLLYALAAASSFEFDVLSHFPLGSKQFQAPLPTSVGRRDFDFRDFQR